VWPDVSNESKYALVVDLGSVGVEIAPAAATLTAIEAAVAANDVVGTSCHSAKLGQLPCVIPHERGQLTLFCLCCTRKS